MKRKKIGEGQKNGAQKLTRQEGTWVTVVGVEVNKGKQTKNGKVVSEMSRG